MSVSFTAKGECRKENCQEQILLLFKNVQVSCSVCTLQTGLPLYPIFVTIVHDIHIFIL